MTIPKYDLDILARTLYGEGLLHYKVYDIVRQQS